MAAAAETEGVVRPRPPAPRAARALNAHAITSSAAATTASVVMPNFS